MAINKENQKTMRENTTKVILNVPNEIAEEFKELAIKRGIPRSSMIIYAMSWYLDYNKSLDLMPKMIESLKSAEDLAKKDKE
jgi:metal-responsive CopG/Arc/MetJ family transcriptional regulator